jgi:hypothetical protein
MEREMMYQLQKTEETNGAYREMWNEVIMTERQAFILRNRQRSKLSDGHREGLRNTTPCD